MMMEIPQIQNLVDQTYKSNQVEFTWRLPTPEAPTLQIVLEVNSKGVVHVLQNKMVKDSDGDWTADDNDVDMTFNSVSTFERNLSKLQGSEYEKFTGGKSLVKLAKEVVEYLK